MASTKTTAQIKADYLGLMGLQAGEAFTELMQDSARLHLKWNEFLALFAGDALASEATLARLDNQILELEQQRAMRRAELARWVGDESSQELGDLPWKRELAMAPEILIQEVASHPPLAPIAARVAAGSFAWVTGRPITR